MDVVAAVVDLDFVVDSNVRDAARIKSQNF